MAMTEANINLRSDLEHEKPCDELNQLVKSRYTIQLLNNAITNKAKVTSPCLDPFFFVPKPLHYLSFQSFGFEPTR